MTEEAPMTDTAARLAAIEARANAAAEEPWEASSDVGGASNVVVLRPYAMYAVVRDRAAPDTPAGDVWLADNARFIAHARTDVPWLVEQVRRRDAAIAAVLRLSDEWERGATRWANPLPVPPEVELLRAAIAAELAPEVTA